MKTFFILLFLHCSSTASAKESRHQIEIQPEQSSIEFLAVGRPSAIKIRGENGKFEKSTLLLSGNKMSGQIKVNLNEFTTGIALRDKHMKEKYLETQKEENRFATLEITKLDIPDSFWNNSLGGNFPFFGSLSLHGVKKDISGVISVEEKKEDSFIGKTNLSIKLIDYNIDIPKFSGITVAENVEVEVKIFAKSSLAP